jgi:hypothetical protein
MRWPTWKRTPKQDQVPVFKQHVPRVDRGDVLRVLKRDFPAEDAVALLAELDQYGTESWHYSRDRVQLAILKLADGQKDRLLLCLKTAKTDFRDVVAPAEYAEYRRRNIRLDSPPEEQAAAIEADCRQYEEWLRRA